MPTIVIYFDEYAHQVGHTPKKHGGILKFLRCFDNGNTEPFKLPAPVIEQIMTANLSTVEFFPWLHGPSSEGTALDYYLITSGKALTERAAAERRRAMYANVKQVVEAHEHLLQFKSRGKFGVVLRQIKHA